MLLAVLMHPQSFCGLAILSLFFKVGKRQQNLQILNKTNKVKFWLTIYSYFDVS